MATHELRAWRTEKNHAYLYRALADRDSGHPRQWLFLELARDADEQAALWALEVRKSGAMPPVDYRPGGWLRLVARGVRWLGPRNLLTVLKTMHLQGLDLYAAADPSLPDDPEDIAKPAPAIPAWATSPTLRSAAPSLQDGLSALFLLVLGVAGAGATSDALLLTGVVGLLAGAIAMAASESLTPAALPASEAERYTADRLAVIAELTQLYRRRGMSLSTAGAEAAKLIAEQEPIPDWLEDETAAMATSAPPSLQAGGIAFFAFMAGGAAPLLPYLLEIRRHPLLIATCIGVVGLMCAGAVTSQMRGRQAVWGGLRLTLIVGSAGAVCYATGRWLAG